MLMFPLRKLAAAVGAIDMDGTWHLGGLSPFQYIPTLETMYRIPKELDLKPVVGEFTTQLRVGQYDIQFTFGPVDFMVESSIKLHRGPVCVAQWEPCRWPDAGFYDIMNVNVVRCEIVGDRRIIIEFETGLEMHLEDDSDQYESMKISFAGNPSPWII